MSIAKEFIYPPQKQILQLSQQFRRQRLARNITQEEVAEKARIGIATVRRFEKGEGISLIYFIQLLGTLGISCRIPSLEEVPLTFVKKSIRKPLRQRARGKTER